MDGLTFKSLSLEDNVGLCVPFSVEEIKEVVWSCDGDKSMGSDGFNFTFLKKFWSSLSNEVSLLVEDFFSNSRVPSRICSSFVALVPKRIIHKE